MNSYKSRYSYSYRYAQFFRYMLSCKIGIPTYRYCTEIEFSCVYIYTVVLFYTVDLQKASTEGRYLLNPGGYTYSLVDGKERVYTLYIWPLNLCYIEFPGIYVPMYNIHIVQHSSSSSFSFHVQQLPQGVEGSYSTYKNIYQYNDIDL